MKFYSGAKLVIMLDVVTILLYCGYYMWPYPNFGCLVIGMACYHFAYYHYCFWTKDQYLHFWVLACKHFD